MSWSRKGTIEEVLAALAIDRDATYRGNVERTIIEGQLEAIRALPSCRGGEWRIMASGHINNQGIGEEATAGSSACVNALFRLPGAPDPF